tara:strand:+ start:1386 stop:1568 length:183 start_codon:yes stop_codon:yes gene_type:complete
MVLQLWLSPLPLLRMLMKIAKWHREKVENLMYRWGLTSYQMLWLSFLKGLVVGVASGALI